jgi:hypothetical protein
VATGRGLDRLDRLQLAGLGREYLLAGHLVDRAGMPEVVARLGAEALAPVAIEEWSGASPHYTRRIRRLLGFDSEHDVASIFKGMQFDVGAPHEFLDFRYRVVDEHHGGFHLAHCGALVDVEPMGDGFVHAMCHDIEDPTFEATVCASNPQARMTPVHRPPRLPADRSPARRDRPVDRPGSGARARRTPGHVPDPRARRSAPPAVGPGRRSDRLPGPAGPGPAARGPLGGRAAGAVP